MIKNNLIYAICLICLNYASTKAITPVRQCADATIPLPLMVNINDCTKLPCDILKGEISKIEIQFVATKDLMRQLTAKVHLTTLGMTIPYVLPSEHSNICQNLMYHAICPLYAGEDVTYALNLPISAQQLDVPTKLEVNIWDDSDNTAVACFVADVRVKTKN